MRCHICDKELTDKEVVFNKELNSYEPCATCLEIAMDAAYCDGFQVEDDSFIIIDENYTNMGDGGDIIPRSFPAGEDYVD